MLELPYLEVRDPPRLKGQGFWPSSRVYMYHEGNRQFAEVPETNRGHLRPISID